jgi:hypothetical protein
MLILIYIISVIIVIAGFIWSKLQEIKPRIVSASELIILAIELMIAPITVIICAAVLIYAVFSEEVTDRIYAIKSLSEKIIFKF